MLDNISEYFHNGQSIQLDQYHFQVASYTPLLMISGQLDSSTPFDQATQLASITSKTRTFYAIPIAGHITINIAAVGYYCPSQLICSWTFPDLFPKTWSDSQLGRHYSMKFMNISRPFHNHTDKLIPNRH
ncbi:hypothetical protein I4U23_015262 [Adineta vaga]|nr:hypothetical protein I4U23_015262 [Adineta vaga]